MFFVPSYTTAITKVTRYKYSINQKKILKLLPVSFFLIQFAEKKTIKYVIRKKKYSLN